MTVSLKEVIGRIEKIQKINENINRYSISIPEQIDPEYAFSIRLGVPGREITRPYSPIKHINCEERTHLEIIIKIYAAEPGRQQFTPLLRDRSEGDAVRVLWYVKKVSFPQVIMETHKRFLFICAGTGITPILQLLTWVKEKKERKRNYALIFFNRAKNQSIFTPEVSAEYAELDIELEEVFTDQNRNEEKKGLKRVYELANKEIESTLYFVCGPDSFVEEVAGPRNKAYGGILKAIDVPENQCINF
ncbi:cytochrome-b5 reductase [Nematocida sp. LUAm1]|nr:cytochrome-b5 reductase [Nematocida sp. LUAm2]KAI5177462.1 cytochrome-b5 reductase [Nematocida sp. LUAm1]